MPCDSPYYVLPKAGTEKVPVPCGKCPPCKKRRIDGWVFRMMQQEKVATFAHFVTLTYDTTVVPISPNGFMTLEKSDFQAFMKRLRKNTGIQGIKYYAVGEYGTKNNRPHYHAIIFDCPDKDAYNTAWGKGNVHVGDCTNDSVAYCMKYLDKPHKKRIHARDDREFEFPLMSKGIGKNYLTKEVIGYHKADITRLYVTKAGGHKVALPRYYREKIYSEQEKKQQVIVIASLSEQKDLQMRKDFYKLYPNATEDDYQRELDQNRLARYYRFYSNQKNRDI